MVRIGEDLAGDWRRLDGRIEVVSAEIEELAHADATPAARNPCPLNP
jgi:hypothetical protein